MTNLSNLTNKHEQRFRSLALLTVIVVYLLILAGGIVRGTGSGMGCPDWPKCFGRWVPPTDISQLPPNYQEIYGAKLKGEVVFNAVKTWIEYVNRLLGVFSGLLVFATLLASIPYLRKDKTIFWGSVAAFLLIGANGWLGSRVVATELAQFMITLHLLLAILVVFSLIFVWVRSNGVRLSPQLLEVKSNRINWLLITTVVLTLSQVLLGTQVRDALDEVVRRLGYSQREQWIENLDWRFYIHRSFSLVILAFHIAVVFQLRKMREMKVLNRLFKVLIALVVAEIVTGAIMGYFSVPAFAQPIHLLLAIIMVGVQFISWLVINPKFILPKRAVNQHRFIPA